MKLFFVEKNETKSVVLQSQEKALKKVLFFSQKKTIPALLCRYDLQNVWKFF